jgi:hypothetical protein
MTGTSIPHPNVCVHIAWHKRGEEIVHSRWKHRGRVNPLVVGSNPTGPTTLADFRQNQQARLAAVVALIPRIAVDPEVALHNHLKKTAQLRQSLGSERGLELSLRLPPALDARLQMREAALRQL